MDKIQTLKGFRDFLPEQSTKRQYVINTLKEVFTRFGFEPLETPTLEYEEILTGKYGEEGDKLMYRFEDNGGRRVAMRYDQTVPLARVVAEYQHVFPFPFKRYQIQNVFRADNTQKGRFREFLQCDIDTVGSNSPSSDAEIVAVVNSAFTALGFDEYTIQLNDRSVFKGVPQKAITIIDKLEKQGEDSVSRELEENGFSKDLIEELRATPEPETLTKIMETAKSLGVSENRISYNPTLARGLDYYTGLIIEVSIPDYNAGSVGGGGRYDKLIGMFLPAGRQGTKEDVPAVGFAFGFDRIIEAMEEKNLFPNTVSQSTKVLVTVFGPELAKNSLTVARELRENGITTQLWLDDTVKIDKQIKYADQKNIPYVVIIGPDEATNDTVMLKSLSDRTQKQVDLTSLKNEII